MYHIFAEKQIDFPGKKVLSLQRTNDKLLLLWACRPCLLSLAADKDGAGNSRSASACGSPPKRFISVLTELVFLIGKG